jgi:hypothetical protein
VADLFASGRMVELIIGLAVLEGLLLAAYRVKTGRGIAPRALLTNLAAGICLLFALRGALTGAGWPILALWLSAALVAHLADLALRWPSHGMVKRGCNPNVTPSGDSQGVQYRVNQPHTGKPRGLAPRS